MDINKIFDLFESKTGKGLDNNDSSVVIDFKDTPIYWIGMFKKIIQNNKIFSKILQNQFSKMEYEVDLDNIEEIGIRLGFSRGWDYISKIDTTNKVHIDSLNLNIDKVLIYALESSILYFQEIEEYEKCAHLKKILDISKHLLT
jgi:hypothetical protein